MISTDSYAYYKRTTTTTTTTTRGDPDAASENADHYLNFDINTKKIYRSPQVVDGQVIVRNDSGETLPGVFRIRLYHDDRFIKELETKIDNIRPGQNVYTLEEFGIPTINANSTNTPGNWNIVIYKPEEGTAFSKEASFRILPVF